jgi:hypothetical protein
MLGERCADLRRSIEEGLGILLSDCSNILPVLGFSAKAPRPETTYAHLLLVNDLDDVWEFPPLP